MSRKKSETNKTERKLIYGYIINANHYVKNKKLSTGFHTTLKDVIDRLVSVKVMKINNDLVTHRKFQTMINV